VNCSVINTAVCTVKHLRNVGRFETLKAAWGEEKNDKLSTLAMTVSRQYLPGLGEFETRIRRRANYANYANYELARAFSRR